MTEKRFLWHVEAVLPPVRERYPAATFIKVLRERWVDEVLINPSVDGTETDTS